MAIATSYTDESQSLHVISDGFVFFRRLCLMIRHLKSPFDFNSYQEYMWDKLYILDSVDGICMLYKSRMCQHFADSVQMVVYKHCCKRHRALRLVGIDGLLPVRRMTFFRVYITCPRLKHAREYDNSKTVY